MFNRIHHAVKFNVMDTIVRKTAAVCSAHPTLIDEVTEVLQDHGWTLEQYLTALNNANKAEGGGDLCWD